MSKRIAFFICLIGIMAFSACQNINITEDAQAETPTFDTIDGTYVSPKTITITSSTADAVIRYTLDGTAPSKTAGTLYAGPLVLSATGTVTIKAVAYTDALLASSVGVVTYKIIPLIIAAPATVTASPANAAVSIAWTTVDGATGYNIYYKAGSTVAKTDTKATGSPYTTSPATISGLTNSTTYAFIVTAYDADGESDASTVITATPAVFIPQPDPPILNTLTAENGKTTVSWSEITVAATYTLYWKQAASVSQDALNYGAILQDIPSTTLSKSISLTNGIIYSFVVTATNAGGQSIDSNVMSIIPGVPGVPTNPIATAKGPTEIEISWSAPATGSGLVLGYNIYRYSVASTPPASPTYAGVTSPFSDVTLINGGDKFYYSIKATSVAGVGCDSSFSSEVSATTPFGTPPNAPTGLTVNSVSDGTVSLRWTAPSGGYEATSYNIYYKLGGTVSTSDYTGISTTTTATLSKAVTPLSNTSQYAFIVTGVNAYGEGVASEFVTATPVALPGAPSVTATASATLKRIDIAIVKGTGGDPDNYAIYWGTSAGACNTLLNQQSELTYAHVNASFVTGTTYYYQVSGINDAGEGSRSTAASAYGSVPPTPTISVDMSKTGRGFTNNFTCYYMKIGAIDITSTNATGSHVTGSRSGIAATDVFNATGAFTNTADYSGPTGLIYPNYNTVITWAGHTFNEWGESTPTTTPYTFGDAEQVNAVSWSIPNKTSSSITVAWTAPVDTVTPDHYAIYSGGTSSSGPWTLITTYHTAGSHPFSGLSSGVTYYYSVVAYDEINVLAGNFPIISVATN